MSLKKIGFVLFLFFSLFSGHLSYAQVENAGIIPANIWYSSDPFQEGDKIKIYTVVYNRDSRELSGTVIFFDHTLLLGTKTFTVGPKSVKDVSIDWNVSAGEHTIFAKIENAKFLISKDKYEEVYVAENKTEESKRTVSPKVTSENSVDKVVNSVTSSDTVSNVKQIVEENTPVFVTKAIGTTMGTLETVRENIGVFSTDKKESLKKEIDSLTKTEAENEKKIAENTVKNLSGEKDTGKTSLLPKENKQAELGRMVKPFKYVQLFFFSLISFVFQYPIVFYLLLILVVFLFLRFIWRLFF